MPFEGTAYAISPLGQAGQRTLALMARRRRRLLVLAGFLGGLLWWRQRKLAENDRLYGAAHR